MILALKLQWGCEIRMHSDFEWMKRGQFVNGLDFKWDLDHFKSGQMAAVILNYSKFGQICPDFE